MDNEVSDFTSPAKKNADSNYYFSIYYLYTVYATGFVLPWGKIGQRAPAAVSRESGVFYFETRYVTYVYRRVQTYKAGRAQDKYANEILGIQKEKKIRPSNFVYEFKARNFNHLHICLENVYLCRIKILV